MDNCPVCLLDIIQLLVTLTCGHKFHMECAYRWLAHKPSCPLCRTPEILPEGVCGICFSTGTSENGPTISLDCGHVAHAPCLAGEADYACPLSHIDYFLRYIPCEICTLFDIDFVTDCCGALVHDECFHHELSNNQCPICNQPTVIN